MIAKIRIVKSTQFQNYNKYGLLFGRDVYTNPYAMIFRIASSAKKTVHAISSLVTIYIYIEFGSFNGEVINNSTKFTKMTSETK